MGAPRITIGVPVMNGARFLPDALASIAAQTYTDHEVLISDNASTDETEALGRAAAAADPRVRYVRQDANLGASGNYNYVAREARGELFKWCAHDDMLAPTFLERCVAALDERPDAVLAFPRTEFVDAAGAHMRLSDADLPWSGGPPHRRLADLLGDWRRSHLHDCSAVCGVIRQSALRTTRLVGPFNSSDNVLLVELALLGDWARVTEPLFLRRLHAGTSLAANATPEQVAAWFDPRAGERFPMPRTRLFRGHLTAVLRAPLPRAEKLRCLAVLRRRFGMEWRVIGGEFKIALRARLTGGFRAAS